MTWQALWLYDEASSGTTPTTVADHLASPIALTISYGAGGAWTSIADGNGLGAGAGAATYAQTPTGIDANKLSCLGTTTWTLELVISLPFSGTDRVVLSVHDSDTNPGALVVASYFTTADKLVAYFDQIGLSLTFDVSGLAAGDHVMQWVYDSTQGTASDRIRLYIDGTPRTLTVESGSMPALNSAQSLFSGSRITAGGYAGGAFPFLSGSIYELAVADHAASGTECSDRATALLADNDADPDAGAPAGDTIAPPLQATLLDALPVELTPQERRRARVNVAALVPPAAAADQPPLKLRRSLPDAPVREAPLRPRRSFPSSVDEPTFLLWASFNDDLPPERVQRARRFVIPQPPTGDAPPLGRARGRTDERVLEEPRIRRSLRMPESVDAPPPRRRMSLAEEARPERLPPGRRAVPEQAPLAADAPPPPRARLVDSAPFEEPRVQLRRRLPESFVPPDAPPLARRRTMPDAPIEEARIARRRLFLGEPEQGPLALRRLAEEPSREQLPARARPLMPQSVDAPPPRRLSVREEAVWLDWRAPRRGVIDVPPAPADQPPLRRWRTAPDSPPEEGGIRLLRRWPESYVPPPVDDPPLRRRWTLPEAPPVEFEIRRLPAAPRISGSPVLVVRASARSHVLGPVQAESKVV